MGLHSYSLLLYFWVLIPFFFFFLFFFFASSSMGDDGIESSSPPPLPRHFLPSPSPQRSNLAPFRPSIAVIVGVLTTMFSITFLLLLYAKHCKRSSTGAAPSSTSAPSTAQRKSGIDRSVVESLPLFRFGSLRGQKDGLECAVCLSRFDPAELLRLLPKCKHAFHIECVDTWLDAHSTCPLCRYRVDPEDVLLVQDPGAEDEEERKAEIHRISGRHSSAGEKSSGLDRPDPCNTFRKSTDTNLQKTVRVGCFERAQPLDRRRFEHRIILSDAGPIQLPRRWSDFKPSDMLYLRSEMALMGSSSSSSKQRENAHLPTAKDDAIKSRCVSEITGISRFRREEEETAVSRWMGFAAARTNDGSGNSSSSSGGS